MKRPFLIMVFLGLGAFCLAGNAHLRLATTEWEPYEYSSNNSVTGFSTEVIKNVLNRMGVMDAEFRVLPWARAITLLSTGEMDAVYSCSRDSTWENNYYYASESIYEATWVMFINKENVGLNDFNSYSDLNGKRIGVVRGYSYTHEFWNYLNLQKNYVEVTFEGQMYTMLSLGRIDYAAGEYVVGMHQIRKNGLSNIVALVKNPIKESSMHIMFSKKKVSKAFVDEFSQELIMFKGTQDFLKLKTKYSIE